MSHIVQKHIFSVWVSCYSEVDFAVAVGLEGVLELLEGDFFRHVANKETHLPSVIYKGLSNIKSSSHIISLDFPVGSFNSLSLL